MINKVSRYDLGRELFNEFKRIAIKYKGYYYSDTKDDVAFIFRNIEELNYNDLNTRNVFMEFVDFITGKMKEYDKGKIE